VTAAEDRGTDRDPALLAEAAFEAGATDIRHALAVALVRDEPAKQEEFRATWARFQARYEAQFEEGL
jgi:hypothetical protein